MRTSTKLEGFAIRGADPADLPLILSFIRELAEYEKLSHEVVATEDSLRASLFGDRPAAEVIIGEWHSKPAAFAVFFHNFSTFLGRPGIYLEDVYVRPEMRGKGIGRIMLSYLAKIALERNCGRFEWWVLDWNEPALRFYRSIDAVPMDQWTVQRLTGAALERLAEEFDQDSPKP
ncbi:MAG: GNAT family N-acetyltransferase [Proteobacteria bacterium]|nr:MAG: GNAT family N-acetyltransferase [Pseudomonadota bacterium]